MRTVIIHSEKYNCAAVFIKDELFVQRLAKLLIKMIIENNRRLKDLPEARAVLLKFMPLWAKNSVEHEVDRYFEQSGELELEGFIRFRLNEQVSDLDEAISAIVKCVLNDYRNYV